MKFAYEKPAKSCEMEDFNCRRLELKFDLSASCKNKAEWKRPKNDGNFSKFNRFRSSLEVLIKVCVSVSNLNPAQAGLKLRVCLENSLSFSIKVNFCIQILSIKPEVIAK